MRYLSLFSGVEAASLAWEPLGWEPAAFCEFDGFPSAVLAHHWPWVPNLGDITTVKEKQIKALGHIDLVVFGSPCQDLSVAGKKKGFDGERSGLFRDAIKVIKWAVKHCGARFALWENVPGALSSNQGADFREVLGSLSGSQQQQPERWGGAGCCFGKTGLVEWATLDAQHFGVPQRRRRVFALADFGDWRDRQPVLVEPESLRRDPAPGKGPGEDAAREPKNCAAADLYNGTLSNTTMTLQAGCHGVSPHNTPHVIHGTQDPIVSDSTAHCLGRNSGQENVIAQYGPVAGALTARHDSSACADRRPNIVVSPLLEVGARTGKSTTDPRAGIGIGTEGDPMFTLQASKQHGVAVSLRGREGGGTAEISGDVSTALRAADGGGGDKQHVLVGTVRRLTPVECERLQGMPDNWTKIPWRGKPAGLCPDGPRYKAIGNSMAVPVMRWIGEQIETIEMERNE